jgi:NurA-like 5'-3' nuclease
MSGLKSWKDNQDNQAQRDYEWRTQYDSRVRDLEQKIQSQKDLGDGIKRVEDGLKDLKTEVSKSVTTHKIDQDKINKKIETELKDVREKALERKFIDKALVYAAAVITGIVLHHYFGH